VRGSNDNFGVPRRGVWWSGWYYIIIVVFCVLVLIYFDAGAHRSREKGHIIISGTSAMYDNITILAG